MNGHIGPTGFSAHQWVFGHGGGTLDDEQLLPGISPHKAFDGLAKARERPSWLLRKNEPASVLASLQTQLDDL